MNQNWQALRKFIEKLMDKFENQSRLSTPIKTKVLSNVFLNQLNARGKSGFTDSQILLDPLFPPRLSGNGISSILRTCKSFIKPSTK